ncbi:hypothetical protein RCH10_004457 [Variovorax sp. GrIS 2.14]|uniref:hypothetical protein n=1 Tax=Variovorax sp. GrIS 2.14 TaxID=3071709 RepID=UPI0038F6B924
MWLLQPNHRIGGMQAALQLDGQDKWSNIVALFGGRRVAGTTLFKWLAQET